MNALCYKIVFSKRLGALVAVGEHTSGQGKAAGTGVRTAVYPSSTVGATGGEFVGSLKAVFASVALTCFTATTIAAGPAANTLPTGYSVNSGNVAVSTSGADMTIKQTTDKASVNWQSFSIGSAASVNIQQNSASSVLLNRVVGNDPSQIFGKLTANGQVILINPNGVVFGKGGSVTASAFTASTFGMTDADFLAGKHKFTRDGSTHGVTVENGASINTTAPGGYVALIGASVDNQGAIATKEGAVVLAAGESVALPAAMTDSVGIPLSKKVRLELAPSTINASVENGGTITTEGGQVLMQAAALSDAVASITHTGTIDTTGDQGGSVTLQADHGIIKATGTIKANSKNAKNKGGDIIIGRDEVTGVLAKATDVSSAKIESNKGFVETSGEHLKTDDIYVKAGQWLLDPTDITITGAESGISTTPGNPTTNSPSTTGTTASSVSAATLASTLSNGTSVVIKTTNAQGTGNGDITVASSVNVANGTGGTSNTGGDATLTLEAERHIVVKSGVSIKRTGDHKLNVVLNSDTDSTNGGAIVMENTSSILTNGGNITMGGGANAAGFAKGTTGNQSGVALMGTTLNAGAGTIAIKGQQGDATGSGVLFSGTNTLLAATYTIEGIAATGDETKGNGVYFKSGTTTLNSTAGASTVTGTTSNTGWGVFGYTGNTINVNSGSGTAAIQSGVNSANGVRFGWNKGVTLNTSGDVTLGSHVNVKASLTFQADVNATGKLSMLGRATGGGDGIYYTEGAGNGAKIIGTNATVLIHGISEGSGRGVILQPAGAANSISSTGTGSIEIIGTSDTGSGVRVGATTITSGGLTKITGTSKGGTGDGVTSTGVVNAGSIDIRGTAVGGRGVVIGAIHNASSGDVFIEGKSTSTIAAEVSAAGAINANGANTNITLLGTSQNSVGIQLASTLTAKNLVTVTGESKANTTGTFFTGTSGVDAASYQVKGTSATATGINIDGGTTTFKSTSNTTDSLIEGKGAAWGIQKSSGTLNLTSNGSAKVKMQSASESTGGGMQIGSADGLTVNTKGDVTIGSTHNNALLTIQRTIFKANGGNLSIKGQSAGNGITMQDGGGNPVQIVGTNGANISVEGVSTSSGVGTGIHMGLGNQAATHSITTNGTVTLTGKAANGFGINTYSSTITGSTVNINADTLSIGSTINAGTSANPGTGTVNINTVTKGTLGTSGTPGTEILIGASDVTTPGSQKLGLSQDELGRINAKNLVIGDTSTGNITVSGAATTAASTGNITLKTGGSIAVNAALTVGDAAGTKNLILDAGGAITNGASGKLTAQNLTLKAGSTIGGDGAAIKTNVATANLTSAGNQFLVEDNNVKVTAKTTDNGNINITTTNGTMTVEPVNGVSGIDAGTGNVGLTATSGSGHAIVMSSNVKGKDITVDATANNVTGLGFYGAGGSFTASGTLNLTGTATGTGNGFYSFGGTHTAQTGINITGTSANGQGVGFDRNVVLTNANNNIVITGTSNGTGTNTEAIGLRGSSITNTNGDIKLVAVKGNVITNSEGGTPGQYWGLPGPLTNTITNNGTGEIQILAGSTATDTGAIDGKVLTINQNGNGGVLVKTTGDGNVIAPKITNAGSGNVVIAAGSLKDPGDGSGGGQVLTSSSSPVTQSSQVTQNSTGKTFIYSGNAAGTGVLSNLDSTLSNLKADGTANQNADTNAAFGTGAGITGSSAKAQVIFREKLTVANGVLADATLEKTYGDESTKNTSGAALLAEAKRALKNAAANSGTNSTFTTGEETTKNRIVVSKSAIADTLTSVLTGNEWSTSGFLNAKSDAYKFIGMTSDKYDVGTGIDVTVNVTPKTLTLTGTTVADKPFDGNTSATIINNGTLDGLVGNETLNVTATGTFNNSSVGNQKPVAITGKLANGTGLASNYRVAPASAVANITEAVKPPVPVVPTDGNSRVKIPVGSGNPFALASAEDLADETCTANSIENCYCEPSPLNANVDICYEPKAGAKGSAR